MNRRKTLSIGGLGALLAGMFLVVAAIASTPVVATTQRGDIWTQPAGTPEETSGHSQEVHLPCGGVDVWGSKLAQGSGSWTLYSWPPSAQDHVVAATGTYNFVNDGSQKIGFIPESVFSDKYGPHYKIQVDQDQSKYKTFWVECNKATPKISTTANPTSAFVGDTLKDAASVTEGKKPSGEVRFTLYNPSDVAVYTETVALLNNGTAATAAGHVADVAGTWHWKAEYLGDSNNKAVASNKADEPVVVTVRATPSIVTTPHPVRGQVGDEFSDSAVVSNLIVPTTGTNTSDVVVFKLFDNAECTGTPVYTSTVAGHGNGSYATGEPFVPVRAGTYEWMAYYARYELASNCGDETITVVNGPSIVTTPNPTTGHVGDQFNDSAVISDLPDVSAVGDTVTFAVYDNVECTGTAVFSNTVDGHFNGSYSTSSPFVPTRAGTYQWLVTYRSGEYSLASGCGDEPFSVVSQASPTPTPSPTATPTPTPTATPTATPATPTPSPTGTVLGEVLAQTGSGDNPALELGFLLIVGGLAMLVATGFVWRRETES